MNYKDHFNRLTEFLTPHEPLWNREILENYPQTMDAYNSSWLEDLAQLSKEDLWKFDCFASTEKLQSDSLAQMMSSLSELTKLDFFTYSSERQFPDWAFRKVKEKKRHEITRITALINDIQDSSHHGHTTDIGGGVGHLARVLAHYYGIKTKTIDINKDFQVTGEKRAKSFPLPEGANELEFINMNFLGESNAKKMKSVFTEDSLTLGLHTCGRLSNAVIETHIKMKTKSLLNFGCCYLKMDPESDTNLSNYSKENKNLYLSNWALTLASRGYASMDFKQYLLKERVKSYRFTLQLILDDIFGGPNFISVGDSHAREYWGEFSEYAFRKLSSLKLEHDYDIKKLQDFYESPETQKKVKYMYLGNILRWQFGRALEHYILTDRCLVLEEAGLKVQMKELFDESLSPRNIGIFSTLS
ncbi:methyltransferase [Halobacteriovorax sp.]|uniref:methyltransferase n=1 Tax=Halobacteriovorax sp. TaxID=2020862 RepID=UPI0035647688